MMQEVFTGANHGVTKHGSVEQRKQRSRDNFLLYNRSDVWLDNGFLREIWKRTGKEEK